MLRHVSIFVLEVLPYALAGLIGAFLLAGHLGEAKRTSSTPVELAAVHLVR